MLLAALAALAGASIQAATGFGFALVLSPALFAVLDPTEAVATLLALGLVLNVFVLIEDGGHADWRRIAPMLLAALPGLVAGLLLLQALSKEVLQISVGLAVIGAAALQISARRAANGRAHPSELPGAAGLAAGFLSGVLTTSISVSGPPIVLWLEGKGVSPGEFRATLAASFLALNLAGGAIVVIAGGTGAVRLDVVFALLALAVVGHVLGSRAHRRLAGPRFRAVALGLVACTGVASLVAGLASL